MTNTSHPHNKVVAVVGSDLRRQLDLPLRPKKMNAWSKSVELKLFKFTQVIEMNERRQWMKILFINFNMKMTPSELLT